MDNNLIFLDKIGLKEYFYNKTTKDFEYLVPDIRQTISAKPGYKILAADYSQVEIRIMAFLSGDKKLISAVNSGKDIHSMITTEIFGAKKDFDYDLITLAKKDVNHFRHNELDLLRSNTKTTVFGTVKIYAA